MSESRGRVASHTFLSLKTQFENAGDALINRELVRFCARYSTVHLDVSRCPPGFVDSMAIAKFAPSVRMVGTVGLFVTALVARLSGKRAYYFVSPGGYVGEKRGLAAISLLMNTVVLAAMRLIGVRTCHVGVSFERLGRLHRSVLALRSRLMHRVVARDRQSAEYASACHVRVDRIAPDLAFGAVEYRRSIAGDGDIAISFRVDQGVGQRRALTEMVTSLDQQVPAHVGFRLIAQVERDIPFLEELSGMQWPSGRRVAMLETFGDVDASLDAYRDCRLVVSNRLHSLLFGAIADCGPIPVICEELNGKIVGLFSALGVQAYKPEAVPLAVGKAYATGDFGRSMREVSDQQCADLDASFREIFGS